MIDNKEELEKKPIQIEDTPLDELNDEQIKDTVKSLEPEEILNIYLKDPNVINNLSINALQISQKFNDNWFTVQQLNKKTEFKDDSAIALIQMLILADLAIVKIEKNVQKYKIVINPQQKIKHLRSEIEVYQQKIQILNAEIKRVEDKIMENVNMKSQDLTTI